MKNKIKIWVKFWFWVDLIGFGLTVVLVYTYLMYGSDYSDHVQNLWSNLAIEILGVWISVRIIDFLIDRHRTFRIVRFKLLDNLNYFWDTATNVYEYGKVYQRDVDKLEKEIHYFDVRWKKRKKHFFKNEIQEILALRESMPGILKFSQELKRLQEIENKSDEAENLIKIKIEELIGLITQYKIELDDLRANIWQETNPDD